MLEILMVPPTKPMPITRAVLAAMVVAEDEPDKGAQKDPQQETPPKTTPMKAETTTTVMFLAQLLFRFQAISFFGENAFFFFLGQIHVSPLNLIALI
jgi:hypothetical protein